VAGILGGDLSVFIVHLSMISFESPTFDFVILVSVSTSNHHVVHLMGVERNLEGEVKFFLSLLVERGRDTGDANIDLGDDLQLVPVPQNKHPVGRPGQGDDELVLSLGREARRKELL